MNLDCEIKLEHFIDHFEVGECEADEAGLSYDALEFSNGCNGNGNGNGWDARYEFHNPY